MAVGLRFRTYSIELGTSCDWFVPDGDMPDSENTRGTAIFRDIVTTPYGNTFIYDKGQRGEWKLNFKDISTASKNRIEFVESGWLGFRQITMVYFGTNVTGTTQSVGTYEASQIWGTGYVELSGRPVETDYNMWSVEMQINEFGPDQTF